MPGLGHSRKPRDGDYSLERHARDLEAVIGVVGGRPDVLVGHSMGGMVLLTFCRLFREDLARRIHGTVLVDTSHTNPVCTTTASGLMRALQKPVLEPLLHLTAWLAPAVWLMSWLGYFNGSSHLVGMVAGSPALKHADNWTWPCPTTRSRGQVFSARNTGNVRIRRHGGARLHNGTRACLHWGTLIV